MLLGVLCRHLLTVLVAARLPGLRPQLAPAASEASSTPGPQPPGCQCPRSVSYTAYGGHAPTVSYALTYACPRCGKQVVEHGLRVGDPYYPLAVGGLSTGP